MRLKKELKELNNIKNKFPKLIRVCVIPDNKFCFISNAIYTFTFEPKMNDPFYVFESNKQYKKFLKSSVRDWEWNLPLDNSFNIFISEKQYYKRWKKGICHKCGMYIKYNPLRFNEKNCLCPFCDND